MKSKSIGLFVLMTTCMHNSNAQDALDSKTDTIFLDEVLIKENRISYEFSESARNLSIIDRRDLKQMIDQSLPQILSYQAGVDIRQRGPAGVQADIGIRGGTFEQSLVLLNGIKMTDPQTGHHSLSLPLAMDNLERIEILKGPAARKYGQNAYAGSVNFITKVPDSNRLYFKTYAADFNSWGASLSAAFREKTHAHFISLGTDRSDGYRYNTDYDILNAFYQGEINVNKKNPIEILAGMTSKKFGANAFYANEQAIDQYEEVQTAIASISYTFVDIPKWEIVPRISWRNNNDEYSYIRNKPNIYQNIHHTNTYSLETNATNMNRLGTSGIGFELRNESITGDWLRNNVTSKSNLDGYYRNSIAAYLEHRFTLFHNRLFISPGIYLGVYSDFGPQLFPGIDLGYQLNKYWKMYANVGKSFRIPTFYDQYYQSPVEKGNPELDPEEAWTYEAGLKFREKAWRAEGNYFVRENQKMIDWVLNENDVWLAENFTQVRTSGYEILLAYDLNIKISKAIGIENFQISYNKINQENNSLESISRYAFDHLQDQFIASVNLQLYKNVFAFLSFRSLDRVSQKEYKLFDAKIYWQHKYYTFFMEATNIGNTAYKEVMTPMPGRWFRMGIELELPY